MEQFDYNNYLKNNTLLKEVTEAPVEAEPSDPKTEKFMKDNASFIEKIKTIVGTNPKQLAAILSAIQKKVNADKKLAVSLDSKRSSEFLSKASGQQPVK